MNKNFEKDCRLLKSYLKQKNINGINLYKNFVEKKEKYQITSVTEYKLNKDYNQQALLNLQIGDIECSEMVYVSEKQKNNCFETFAMLLYFTDYVFSFYERICSELYNEKRKEKRGLVFKEYKNFISELALTQDSCIIKVLINIQVSYMKSNKSLTITTEDKIIDLLQECSIIGSILGEYSIPQIYISYVYWIDKNDKNYLQAALNSINLYIKQYLYLFQDADSNYQMVRQITAPLKHISIFKDINCLLIKFAQILELARKNFRDAINEEIWGENCFFETTFDLKVPMISVTNYMLYEAQKSYPSKSPYDLIAMQNAFSALIRGKDLFYILYQAVSRLGNMTENERVSYGVTDKYDEAANVIDFYKSDYENFVYNNSVFYASDSNNMTVLKSKWENDRKNNKIQQALTTNTECFLEFLEGILNDDINSLMSVKQKIYNSISKYQDEQIKVKKLEKKLEEIIEKLRNSTLNESTFISIYESVSEDFVEYFEYLKTYPTLLTSLSSAEVLYDLYVQKMSEKKDFDYSCVSIMYYKTLEDFINKFLYIPYRNDVLEKNTENALESKLYLNDPNFYYRYGKFKKSCELGPLGYLCAEVQNIPKLREYLKFKYHFDSDNCFERLKVLGEELKKKSENRNNAAHGGKIISYKTAKDDKNTVYPNNSPEEIRGLLKEFLDIIFHRG